MRVLVLGAGFGGLELTTRLADELGDDADIVLIDQADGFVFGFSKLDVMFGRTTAPAVRHSYLPHRRAPERTIRRALRAAAGRQGRLRDEPHPALVRPRLVQLLRPFGK